MAVKWTREQKLVIDTRNKNLLVSAAAGSGKTAVLVERILSIITDKKKPVDIDRLLVLTFTNAAASEMRERIRDVLEIRAEAEPDDEHLQRQLVLVHNAKITTIHSFCLQVLRSHFQAAGIDPSFRVADEGEILLLEQEAIQEVLEDAYAEKEEDFIQFLEAAVTGKNDKVIEEMVLQLYHFALGQPWPEDWLEECRQMYERASSDTPQGDWGQEKPPFWLSYIEEETDRLLRDIHMQALEGLKIAGEADGPYMYTAALESDLEKIDALQAARDYNGYAQAFSNMGSYVALGRKKDENVSEQKREQVKLIRQAVKDALAALKQSYYYDRTEVLQEELAASGVTVRALVRLTEQFMGRIAQKKREKNILDFGDLEHLALQVLVEKKAEDEGTGKKVKKLLYQPTAAALEYAESFEEIMTDEYQDSNLVQELILNSVAGRGRQEPNRFMVGDVKQSIYRFRLARPELFMEKYRTYQSINGEQMAGEEAGSSCRIDLHRNFRSRAEVLEGVNEIFRQIMTENLGGIVYDEDAALHPGAVFEEEAARADSECPLYCNTSSPSLQMRRELSGETGEGASLLEETGGEIQENPHATELWLLETEAQEKQKNEAVLTGRRIRELVGHMPVWDKELASYRPARYSDIVILLRTVSGWADVFSETLSDMGIPCFTGSQKGYFSAAEIRIILAYLQILDNPLQDIPMAAVLRSAIGRLGDEELAKIRVFSEKRSFYDCVLEYRQAGEDEKLKRKLEAFFAVFEELRAKCEYTPVHLLLWEILDATGYGEYAASLPGGAQRKANLDMLVEKAIAYGATSYRGLYHFIRYIENLKKYEVDYGEANIGAEADDTVRIMSIHKSKGLEFPIVFVCGMGKKFNETDSRSKIVVHPEFGIGCDYVDTACRYRQATLLKKVIQKKTIAENLGEELRVLYVAMTRAKEKLILTGSAADLEGQMAKWLRAAAEKNETLSYSCLSGASSCLDWVVPALLSKEDTRQISGGRFVLHIVEASELKLQKFGAEAEEAETLAALLNCDPEENCDAQAREYLEEVFDSVYAYEKDRAIKGKLSVSELKKRSSQSEEEQSVELYPHETVVPLLPQFRQEEVILSGANRGTVYHTFMENLDYSKKDRLEIQLEEMISCGKMSREESRVLRISDIRRFLTSECGRRMEQAALAGRLYRECPFMLGVAANEVDAQWNPGETVLVQGIIDAYFIENGRISIVDYKTDRVSEPQLLVERYHVQLDYYARALERLTGYKVKECIIYSFFLGQEIVL